MILEALLLGILQGLTEFVPVSSSGHLILAERFFNLEVSSLLFDVMLHFGTLLALIIYFRRDLLDIFSSIVRFQANKMLILLIIGTFPSVIVGFLIQDLAESTFRSAGLVAFNLVWVAILMLIVDRAVRDKKLEDMKPQNALGVGMAQALALIPGVSRSGISIVGGLAQGFSRQTAARFSFLLAIPVTFGAILKLIIDGGVVDISTNLSVFSVGILASAVAGYFAIDWFLKFLAKHGLAVFAYYRIALAAIIFIGILF